MSQMMTLCAISITILLLSPTHGDNYKDFDAAMAVHLLTFDLIALRFDRFSEAMEITLYTSQYPSKIRPKSALPMVPEYIKGRVIGNLRHRVEVVDEASDSDTLYQEAVRLALIQAGDEFSLLSLTGELSDGRTDITFHQAAVHFVRQPRLIQHLIPIASKRQFHPEPRDGNIFIPLSKMAISAILKQVAGCRSFNPKTRESASTVYGAGTIEQILDRILLWYELNEDLFLTEDFTNIGPIWIHELTPVKDALVPEEP